MKNINIYIVKQFLGPTAIASSFTLLHLVASLKKFLLEKCLLFHDATVPMDLNLRPPILRQSRISSPKYSLSKTLFHLSNNLFNNSNRQLLKFQIPMQVLVLETLLVLLRHHLFRYSRGKAPILHQSRSKVSSLMSDVSLVCPTRLMNPNLYK